ncbi:hypothetical protein Tco_1170213, partial [Tanacetum coccineum]
IPSIVDTGKEPIQAPSQSVQSTTRKEPIQSQSNLMSIRLKRVKKSKYVTLSVDEKGRDVLTCNHCQNVIKKVSPEVCFTIPEEEEVEIPSQNVKARTVKDSKFEEDGEEHVFVGWEFSLHEHWLANEVLSRWACVFR